MDIHSLNLFLEVMRQRSFTVVAKQQGTAPSSVSRTIANLEKELGIRLFQRSTRKLVPTEVGIVYFERISPLVRELEAAKQIATDLNEEPKGTLRITSSIVYGQMYIAPLLPVFTKKHPFLTIELLLTDAYLDLIEERIDVSIRLGSLQDSSYIARRLNTMAFTICASPDYIEEHGMPSEPEDIRNHNCLIFPRTGYNTNWLFKDAKEKIEEIPIHGQCLITNSQAIKQCAISGMGLALLPDWLISDDIKSGSLIRLFDKFEVTATDFDSGIYLLYPSREYIPLKTQVFMDHLIEGTRNKRL